MSDQPRALALYFKFKHLMFSLIEVVLIMNFPKVGPVRSGPVMNFPTVGPVRSGPVRSGPVRCGLPTAASRNCSLGKPVRGGPYHKLTC